MRRLTISTQQSWKLSQLQARSHTVHGQQLFVHVTWKKQVTLCPWPDDHLSMNYQESGGSGFLEGLHIYRGGGVVVQVEPSPVCHLPPFCSQKEGSVKVICSPVGEHPFSASPLDPHNNHHDNSTLQEHGCFEFTKQLYNQCPIWLSHQHSNIGQARISNCLL